MKNEKREITLNEKDSLKDMLEAEKSLVNAYTGGAWLVEKKQFREQLLKHIACIFQDAFLISDILSGKNNENN